MDFLQDIDILHKYELYAQLFGKDLKKLFDGDEDCKLFIVVTRAYGDELYHPESLPEPDMSKLRHWIRCGNPAGLQPEWISAKSPTGMLRVYLAGQEPGVDCSSVERDMFAEEGGKKYTYTYCGGLQKIRKISHPKEELPLGTNSPPIFIALKLTVAKKAANNFSEILDLNRRFLLGMIQETPYHVGPVADETLPLIGGLLELHDFRLLTNSSQPYEHRRGRNNTFRYIEVQQRPYVSFLVPSDNDQVLKFFQMLKNRSEIMVRATETYPYNLLPGSNKKIVIRRERVAKTVERLESTPWRGVTWAFRKFNRPEETLFCLNAVKEFKALWFEVAAREWGAPLDLLGLIQELAVKSGLPRSY